MRIETLSIRAVTVIIFSMIGVVAIVLSILAGSYFKQAALNAQMNSLSRVIEVASDEMLKELKNYTFDLGMKMGHSDELVQATRNFNHSDNKVKLTALLDDPFINGFVGFSNVNLEKIRVYGLDLSLIAESQQGVEGLDKNLAEHLIKNIARRQGVERLKAIDALWISAKGPMHSTLVPVGGLRLIGYLEIIVNPVFNLPDIGNITQTPISIYSVSGEPIIIDEQQINNSNYLPINFTLHTSDGLPAFRITGYEDVAKLDKEMGRTQTVTISGFLVMSLITLMFALWLFNRFLFVPLRRMITDMKQVTHGRLDLTVNKKGLREFYVLAETFNLMANQVRVRTNDLERLLDLDGSAILCFGNDNEAVYFNKGASELFGYSGDEIEDLDLADLFSQDMHQLISDASQNKQQTQLMGSSKNGVQFLCDAVISSIDVEGEDGCAIVLTPVAENEAGMATENTAASFEQGDNLRIDVIKQSLNSLLEIAKNDPGLLSGLVSLDKTAQNNSDTLSNKAKLREDAVKVMQSALSCWEHDLSKSKLQLAEESKIWPVYMDKSTPTTRTLDKYLQIDSCPKNPRFQRVVDTAEFVIKKLGDQQTAHQQKLIEVLKAFRRSISGV